MSDGGSKHFQKEKLDSLTKQLLSQLEISEVKYLVDSLSSQLNYFEEVNTKLDEIKNENRIVRTLLKKVKNKSIIRPLLPFPTEGGHVALFREISDYALDEEVDENGNTALMRAIIKGDGDKARQFIRSGVDVNHANKNGETPLMLASVYGSTRVIDSLIDAGADVNEQDKDGWTPLMLASVYKSTYVVSLLIKAGADVNIQNKFGQSALMYAIVNNKIDTVKALIEAGADVNHQDNEGKTPLKKAAENGYGEIARLLLDVGANLGVTKLFQQKMASSDDDE